MNKLAFLIFALALIASAALAQEPAKMIIHLTDGDPVEIELRDIDQITFEVEPAEEPEPGEERVFELIEGVDIVMCWIPAGSFMMGRQDGEQDSDDDEDPRHRVTFSQGFWMGKYELTQAQWEAVMGSNPSYYRGASLPVEQVSWNDIQTFEERVNGFRLPSESEWEYACRAGTSTRFYWGDDPDYSEIGRYAQYIGNSSTRTHPVGEKTANAWGLHDISGNVWEWCEDLYHDSYNGAPDDSSPWVAGGGQYRVLRGGSWVSIVRNCRSANRYYNGPDHRYYSNGVRVVW